MNALSLIFLDARLHCRYHLGQALSLSEANTEKGKPVAGWLILFFDIRFCLQMMWSLTKLCHFTMTIVIESLLITW